MVGGGRGRKGCGTSPGRHFWPLAAWGVVLVTGICTGSQPSPPATTRSRLVARYPVPHHLVPHHLDPAPRTLLPLLAWRQAPNRVTTWRYVGSTGQLGKKGVSCGQRGLQLGKETGEPICGALGKPPSLWDPGGADGAGPRTVQPASVFLLLGSAGEGSARHWLSFSFHYWETEAWGGQGLVLCFPESIGKLGQGLCVWSKCLWASGWCLGSACGHLGTTLQAWAMPGGHRQGCSAEWEGDPKSMLAPQGRPAGPLLPDCTSAVEQAIDPQGSLLL